MKSAKRVGVYFRCARTQPGRDIGQMLENDRQEILSELGSDKIIWNMDEEGGGAGVRMPCEDIFDENNRKEIKDFFTTWINTFINAFRPRIKRIVEDL